MWAKDFPPLLKKNAKGFGEGELKKLLDYIKDPNKETVLIFSCVKPDESSSLVKQLKKQHKIYFLISWTDRSSLPLPKNALRQPERI